MLYQIFQMILVHAQVGKPLLCSIAWSLHALQDGTGLMMLHELQKASKPALQPKTLPYSPELTLFLQSRREVPFRQLVFFLSVLHCVCPVTDILGEPGAWMVLTERSSPRPPQTQCGVRSWALLFRACVRVSQKAESGDAGWKAGYRQRVLGLCGS